MYFSASNLLVQGNTISDNLSEEGGAGIWLAGGSLKLHGNTISNNTSIWLPSGVYCTGGIEAVGNDIFGNNYAGLAVTTGYHEIYNNRIHGNGWAGIDCYKSGGEIANNFIYENDADGINCTNVPSTLYITNNTIFGNQSNGILCQNDSSPSITNTIIYGNVGLEIEVLSGSPIVTYCNVEGGWPGQGNIDANPDFVDRCHWDYHILYTSPCRNAGDSAAPGLPDEDFEGDPRIAYGTADIGADEFYTHLYCTGYFTPGGEMEGKLVGLPGASPVGLFLGSGVLDPPLSTMWGQFHLQPPFFMIPLFPIPGNGVMVLPATIPSTPPAPYDLPMQALIGLNSDSLTNLFVLKVR
ncbi:MAG: right-handed parallel beta-helix repeat-containing protein [Planctomycetota bacterium]|jgi:hypothetical protein